MTDPKPPRISVYAIAKNEAKFVDTFLDSVKDADEVLILDTGSTDDTIEKLKARGAILWRDDLGPLVSDAKRIVVRQITVSPWRFDVARNAALDLVGKDIDIAFSVDLDEVVSPGWYAAVQEVWTASVTRVRYEFIWSHKPDGSPGISYWADKIHARNGYRWKGPVHECLYPSIPEVVAFTPKFKIDHWPDPAKSRSSYLPLLALAVKEDPTNDRNAHYYGRELANMGFLEEAKVELKRHLSLPSAVWEPERARSMELLAGVAEKQGDHRERIRWLLRAVAEAPGEREPWVKLAQAFYSQADLSKQDLHGVLFASRSALRIPVRPASYITEDFAWGSLPHDLNAVASWYAGGKFEALCSAINAVRLDSDPRLKANLENMQDGMMDPYGTHQRLLCAAVATAGGPVLECGAGHYSTPVLHGLCAGLGHNLVTLESDTDWLKRFMHMSSTKHTLMGTAWTPETIPEIRWGTVFIDCAVEYRNPLVKYLLPRADMLVLHDTEPGAEHLYHFAEILKEVPWSVTDKSRSPWSTAISLKQWPDFTF